MGTIHEKVRNIQYVHEKEWHEIAPVIFCKCEGEASLLYVHNNLMAEGKSATLKNGMNEEDLKCFCQCRKSFNLSFYSLVVSTNRQITQLWECKLWWI
jgi:hypothetical protein